MSGPNGWEYVRTVLCNWVIARGLTAAWNRVSAFFNSPTAPGKVLIVGPGGVGKSTLGWFLSGCQGTVDIGQYAESISKEVFSSTTERKTEFVVLPGQKKRIEATFGQIVEDLKSGEFRGVILVLAYGHHALGEISYRNHRLYDKDAPFESFVQRYLEACRNEEEMLFEQVCDAIQKCTTPIWLMIVVTKQDLWWNDHDVVHKHYSAGPYRDIRKKCIGSKEDHAFHFETAFLSLLHRNLMTGRNETLKQTVAGYDQPQQDASFKRFFQVLEGLMKWEESNGKHK